MPRSSIAAFLLLAACAAPPAARQAVGSGEGPAVESTAPAPVAEPASAPDPAPDPSPGAAPPRMTLQDAVQPTKPGWQSVLERLLFYGDFRFRSETNIDPPGGPDNHRARVRVRLGVNYLALDDLLLGFRVVTGDPDDPRSTSVTLGRGFDDLEISLDRAFVSYRPQAVPGFSVTAGKFNHPFHRNPVYGELVWDADVQPEGALVAYAAEQVGPFDRLQVDGGGYVLLNSGGQSSLMGVADVTGQWSFGEAGRGAVGFGYYHYGDLTPGGSTALVDDNRGNAVVDTTGDTIPDQYVSDYGVINPVASLTFEDLGPLVFSGEYIHNLRANIPEDSGWAAGAAWGSTAAGGDWRAYYQYQVIQQDAVFSPLAQDDFFFATNQRGHVTGVFYQFTRSVGLQLWTLISTPYKPATDVYSYRVRLDLNVKF